MGSIQRTITRIQRTRKLLLTKRSYHVLRQFHRCINHPHQILSTLNTLLEASQSIPSDVLLISLASTGNRL